MKKNNSKKLSGCIEFIDPRNSVKNFGGIVQELKDSLPFRESILMHPVEGRLIVFPAWLKHWVTPIEEEDERISISFNSWFINKY